MIAISTQSVLDVITCYKTEINRLIGQKKIRLASFMDDENWSFNREQKKYLDFLYKNFEDVVFALPSNIILLKNNLKKSPKEWRKKQYGNPKSFKDGLLYALDYNGLRRDLYPKYFRELGIKACVYCNAHLTVTTEKKNGDESVFKGKFQVDHYHAKADYPCFSISFFNLYPSCASCNNAKSENKIDFQLYSTLNERNCDFEFFIEDHLLSDFLTNRNADKLEISFKEPGIKTDGEGQFQRLFDIKGIYNTQKDLAEELILKRQVYTPDYKEQLVENFPDIFNSVAFSNRLIIGNYCDEKDIHRRPMAKFTRDIARQVGLIEEE